MLLKKTAGYIFYTGVYFLMTIFFCNCSDYLSIERNKILEGIRLDISNTKTEYVLNAPELDVSGLIIYGLYSDGTEQKEPNALATFDGFITEDAGISPEITVTYKEFTAKYTISIVEAVIERIRIIKNPNIFFIKGVEYSSVGLVLEATLSDGSTMEISDGFEIDTGNYSKDVAGTYAMTLCYENSIGQILTVPFTIIVSNKELDGFVVEDFRKVYVLNEPFDLSALKIQKKYKGEEVSSEYFDNSIVTINNFDTAEIGEYTATITVGSFDPVEITYTVRDAYLTGINVKNNPDKFLYYKGEQLDTDGLVVWGVYDSASVEGTEIKSEFIYSEIDENIIDEIQYITVSYVVPMEDYPADYVYDAENPNSLIYTSKFPVLVTSEKLESISAVYNGCVYAGEELDRDCIIVTGHFTDGDKTLTGYSYSDVDFETEGDKLVTVKVNDKECKMTVTVLPAKLLQLYVIKQPESAVYLGKGNVAISIDGYYFSNKITIGGIYTDGYHDEEISDYICSYGENNKITKAGVHKITVKYFGDTEVKETYFYLYVLNNPVVAIKVTENSSKTKIYYAGAEDESGTILRSDFSGIEITPYYANGDTDSAVDVSNPGVVLQYGNIQLGNAAVSVNGTGNQNIVITYKNCSTSYQIIVKETYLITYHDNGADSGEKSFTQLKKADIPITLNGNSATLSKAGYTFTGWNTHVDGDGTSYSVDSVYSNNALLNLYAQWVPNRVGISANAPTETDIQGITVNSTDSCITFYAPEGYAAYNWYCDDVSQNDEVGSTFVFDTTDISPGYHLMMVVVTTSEGAMYPA